MDSRIDEILKEYTEDDYEELCARADFYGESSLTEEEQLVLKHWK